MPRCLACGHSARRAPKCCPKCGVVASFEADAQGTALVERTVRAVRASSIGAKRVARVRSGLPAFDDAATPGGLALPSSWLVAGGEGAGKTTLAVRLAGGVSSAHPRVALYASAELPRAQVATIARRFGEFERLFILETDQLVDVEREAARLHPVMLVVDSVPMFEAAGAPPGSDAAEAATVRAAIRIAREHDGCAWCLTHATAEGHPAGRRRLRHDVDAVAWVRRDARGVWLDVKKHRYGDGREPVEALVFPRDGASRDAGACTDGPRTAGCQVCGPPAPGPTFAP